MAACEADPVARVAAVLAARTGLRLPAGSADLLAHAVAEQASGSLDLYAATLGTEAAGAELARLFEQVAVGTTQLFRPGSPFAVLADAVLPGLIADPARRPVRLLSAGCSTGEEAWSLAACAQHAGGVDADVEVVGLDWSQTAITAARRAIYPAGAIAAVPAEFTRYFAVEVVDGEEVIRPAAALRRITSFQRANLAAAGDLGPPGSVDVVLFCNVSIYFDRDVTQRVVSRLYRLLRPNGLLFLGPAESLWGLDHHFELVSVGGGFAYRKPSERAQAATEPAAVPPADPAPARAEAHAAAVGLIACGDLDAARHALESLRAANPAVAATHYLLGCVLERSGRQVEALAAYGRALYLDTGFALAHVGRAGIYERRGDRERAAAAFAAAARELTGPRAHRFEPYMESMSVETHARVCAERAAAPAS
jgi:chemotaxis protein methyltransferase WspC